MGRLMTGQTTTPAGNSRPWINGLINHWFLFNKAGELNSRFSRGGEKYVWGDRMTSHDFFFGGALWLVVWFGKNGLV